MRYMILECNGEEQIRMEFEGPLRLEHLYELVEEIADENVVDIGEVTIRFIEITKEEDDWA